MTFIIHTSGPVSIDGTALGGITNLESALGSRITNEPTSGEVFARVTAMLAQKPQCGFTCQDIAAAMALCGPMGVNLASNSLVLYASEVAEGGTIASGSSHLSLTASLGLLVPTSLSCSHQQNAQIGYQAHVIPSSDSADPWTLSTGAALPSVSSVNLWTLDSAEIGGVVVTQHMQLSLDFGMGVRGEGAQSNIRDSLVSIRSILPKIAITSSLISELFGSLEGASGAFSIVLRNRAQGGTFGTATATFSGTCLGLQEQPLKVAGQAAAQTALVGHVEWDGTDDPITFTYAAGS